MYFRSLSVFSPIAAILALSCACALPAKADGKIYPFDFYHRAYSQSGWLAGVARTPDEEILTSTTLLMVSPEGKETTSDVIACREGGHLWSLYLFGVADDGSTAVGFDCMVGDKNSTARIIKIDPTTGATSTLLQREMSALEGYSAAVAPDGGISIASWGVAAGGVNTVDVSELRRGASTVAPVAHFDAGWPSKDRAMVAYMQRSARGDSLVSYGSSPLLTSHLINAESREIKNVTRSGHSVSLLRSGALVYQSMSKIQDVDVVHLGSDAEQHLTFKNRASFFRSISASNAVVSQLMQDGERVRAEIYDYEAGTAMRLTCKLSRRVLHEIIDIGLTANGSIFSDQTRFGRRTSIISFAKDSLGGNGSLRCSVRELPAGALVRTRK